MRVSGEMSLGRCGKMGRLRAVLSSPVRVVLLVVAGVSLVVAGLRPAPYAEGGLVGVTQYAGGIAILVVLVGWRWFWHGVAVERRLRSGREKASPPR